ncbi:hypothetical protein LMG23992_04043 [Cupriavidus laharis]|uniref:SMODS and SLOG-associating 2TM effector domain-containing protein n=1 Tax=Cupriavidus laharis TaxID=151654 RepID=A0ABN7Z6J8_9BURK|nr:SLATT domain-containing protein [Cupriavidus laharis]CAG9179684.1 hypothetical protein LMG23992_04043 [Cupriavidus laharis]
MKKNDLMLAIAETGYNVYFGAQKHFATYHVVEKFPGWISLISFAISLYALFVTELNNNYISALMLCLGVSTMYASGYNHEKEKYNQCGVALTELTHRLRALYYDCKGKNDTDDLTSIEADWKIIQGDALKTGITKQIFGSNWLAHYYLFWQCQIDWIDEQKKFRFLRDKVPLSFFLVVLIVLGVGAWHLAPYSFKAAVACLNQLQK